MLLRPINFLLIYIFSFLHLSILIMPFCFISYLVLKFVSKMENDIIYFYIQQFWWLSLFFISLFCSFYIILDFLFSFTIKNLSKNAKDIKKLSQYSKINQVFMEIKNKFNKQNVDLYISNDEAINACAVGGFKKNRIILTQGIIAHMSDVSDNEDDFINSIAGILAHEMSHIINMDFLPGIFMYSIELAIYFLSTALALIIKIGCFGVSFIPFLGRFARFIINILYKLINFIFHEIVYKKFLVPIDFMLKMILSRATEYRSDMDSAKALGGDGIASALTKISSLKGGAWRSIFSTHPAAKFRVKKVLNIKKIQDTISPNLITDFINMWCILMLFFCTALLSYKSNAQKIPHYSIEVVKLSINKYEEIKQNIEGKVETVKKIYALYQKIEQLFG